MKKTRLLPGFRVKMRELIQGFIEHCEISQTMIGRIERFVHHRGLKYGFPTFTVYGPPQPGLETQFINLLGINEDGDSRTAETLLQLIERIVLQPNLATGHILRILPVTNPAALELGSEDAVAGNLAQLGEVVAQFRDQTAHGIIEISLGDAERLSLSVAGPAPVLDAVSAAEDAVRRLYSESSSDELAVTTRDLQPVGTWTLRLDIPRDWSSALSVHWASQVLVVFFRAYLEQRLNRNLTTGAVVR